MTARGYLRPRRGRRQKMAASNKTQKPTARPYFNALLEVKLAQADIERAFSRFKKLKKREVFDDIDILSPLEVCIDRTEGLLKIEKILTERVEKLIK